MGNSAAKGKGYPVPPGGSDWKGDKVDGSFGSKELDRASRLPVVDVYSIDVRASRQLVYLL